MSEVPRAALTAGEIAVSPRPGYDGRGSAFADQLCALWLPVRRALGRHTGRALGPWSASQVRGILVGQAETEWGDRVVRTAPPDVMGDVR
jgi:hypothetical protein